MALDTLYVFQGKIYLYMSLSFKCEARSWALLSLKSPHMLLKAYIITNKALFWIQYKLSCTLPLHRAGSIYRHTILWLLDRYISWVYRVCILVFMYFCVQIHMDYFSNTSTTPFNSKIKEYFLLQPENFWAKHF